MKSKPKPIEKVPLTATTVRPYQVGLVVALISFSTFFTLAGFSYLFTLSQLVTYEAIVEQAPTVTATTSVERFPIGVNPKLKQITENPDAETFLLNKKRANTFGVNNRKSFLSMILGKLALQDWYQNLASPNGRILVVDSGERKEEIVNNFTKILGWTPTQKKLFLALIASSTPELHDGSFFPTTYMVARKAEPEVVAPLIIERFQTEVVSRYPDDVEQIIPLKDTLTLASLLEREAYDFDDMRYISGVIWNRLFIGMNLQIDATLQYAKSSERGGAWWPQVLPGDKNIASAYNTYKNPGLPPSPIANPSLDAIIAALNPRQTDCLFYFHDKDGGFHCTKTYEEHVALLKQFYGRGR